MKLLGAERKLKWEKQVSLLDYTLYKYILYAHASMTTEVNYYFPHQKKTEEG